MRNLIFAAFLCLLVTSVNAGVITYDSHNVAKGVKDPFHIVIDDWYGVIPNGQFGNFIFNDMDPESATYNVKLDNGWIVNLNLLATPASELHSYVKSKFRCPSDRDCPTDDWYRLTFDLRKENTITNAAGTERYSILDGWGQLGLYAAGQGVPNQDGFGFGI